MLHVVDLQVPKVLDARRSMVKVIVDHIVHYVADVEPNEEGRMLLRGQYEPCGHFEGYFTNDDAGERREDQSEPIRGESVVNSVDQEVRSE